MCWYLYSTHTYDITGFVVFTAKRKKIMKDTFISGEFGIGNFENDGE